MGVDILEFVLEVEDTFGVQLSEDDLESADTVGSLSALVWRRLAGGSGEATPSLWDRPNRVAFSRLRTAMADQLGVPRRAVRPESSLKDWLDLRPVSSHDYVFTPQQGKPLGRKALIGALPRALKRAGIERAGVALHRPRHTCACPKGTAGPQGWQG